MRVEIVAGVMEVVEMLDDIGVEVKAESMTAYDVAEGQQVKDE